MTSLAFILGVLPLMVSHGAGAEMRQTLGVTVFSGMVGVTIFGIFLTPVFFYVIDVLGETALFRSRTVRLASKAALIVLNFATFGIVTGPLWIIRQVRRELTKPSRRPSAPPELPAPHESELPEPEETPELVEQK
jgi:multidrug efflux pump